MATIYRITQMTMPQRQTATTATAGSAEIIMFPGVRYERWEDDKPPASSTDRGATGRHPSRTG